MRHASTGTQSGTQGDQARQARNKGAMNSRPSLPDDPPIRCPMIAHRELLVCGDATGVATPPEHGRLGWSAADLADAIVAARVCLRGCGLLPAANEHDIAQQQRIGPQSLLSGRAEFWPVLDLQVQVRLAGVA